MIGLLLALRVGGYFPMLRKNYSCHRVPAIGSPVCRWAVLKRSYFGDQTDISGKIRWVLAAIRLFSNSTEQWHPMALPAVLLK